MKHRSIMGLLVGLTLFVSAHDHRRATAARPLPGNADERPQKRDAKTTHLGVWKPSAGSLGGNKLPDAFLKTMTLKLTPKNYEVVVPGQKQTDKGTCTLDTSTKPNRMTIKGTSGPNKGKTLLAIIEMQGTDSLRIGYDLSGKAFAKTFTAPQGSQNFLLDYRRHKLKQGKKPAPKSQAGRRW